MKKRIISLILIVVLCVSLCACGREVPQEQLDMLCGMWWAPWEGKNDEGLPGYLEFTADGQCTYNGEVNYTWAARAAKKDNPWIEVTIKSESKEKHTFRMYLGDAEVRDGELTLGKEGPNGAYRKVNTVSESSWINDAMIEWFAQDNDENVAQSVIIKEDGTITIDGKLYFWTTENYSDRPESYAHFNVFDANGLRYYLDINKHENGLLYMSMQMLDDEGNHAWGSSYVSHPLLKMLDEDGNWRSFDRYTCIDDYLYFGLWTETSNIGDVEYDLSFDVSNADSVTINFLDGGNVRYVAKSFMDGEYFMTVLTDVESGAETLYYNDTFGYAEDHPDAAYYKVINPVYMYANGSSFEDPETGDWVDYDEAMPYLYEKLQALGDYKQTQEFLDRFTIVPSKLTEVRRYTTDQLNNVSDTWLAYYKYDENGTMIALRGEEVLERYGINETYDWIYLTYDANGRVSLLEDKSGDTIYLVGTPTYDAMGNLISMDVATTSGQYTSTFTYDENGRRILTEVPQENYDEPMIWAYTYDEQGNVIAVVETWGSGYYNYDITYTYANGAVVSKTVTYFTRGTERYSTTYEYTNDVQGRHLSAVVTTTDEDATYKSREVVYTYEDLYFFDNTGLVFEEE